MNCHSAIISFEVHLSQFIYAIATMIYPIEINRLIATTYHYITDKRMALQLAHTSLRRIKFTDVHLVAGKLT